MLSPKERNLLLESLRPPEGYRLDTALCTTYSLDLMALLIAPLAFTFFDWESEGGEPTTDPNALLEAIRRHADHIHVFCQVGQISIPAAYQTLFSYLEPCVHEARAHRPGGIFHPKVWVLRYVAKGEKPRYRLLCASRNLTFDRSWDTLLVLDGEVSGRVNRINKPLSRFLQALPGLSIQRLSRPVNATIKQLEADLNRVEFQLPEHIEDVRFWPLGLPGRVEWPFPEQADRGVIISPFLSGNTLDRLSSTSKQTLISRIDSLMVVKPAVLDSFETFSLSDVPDLGLEESTDNETVTDPDSTLDGLHTKLFAFDIGDLGYVWTGSANATNAAFHNNVEFLVEMRGQARKMGAKAILAPQQKGISVLRDLLEPFSPGKEGGDTGQQLVDRALNNLRQYVADMELEVHAEEVDESLYDLKLTSRGNPSRLDAEFMIECWPITLKQDAAAQQVSVGNKVELAYRGMSFQSMTTFFAFEGQVTVNDKSGICRFVLNLPCTGFPENRRQQLLRYMLKDREQVMRYLLLLLAEDGTLSLSDLAGNLQQAGSGTQGEGFHTAIPMFESLVRALERSPEKLDHVEKLVTELQSTEEGRALLPDDFDQIWEPLWAARKELARNAG